MKKILIFILLLLSVGVLSSCGSKWVTINIEYTLGEKTTKVIASHKAGTNTAYIDGKLYKAKTFPWANKSEIKINISKTPQVLKYTWDEPNCIDTQVIDYSKSGPDALFAPSNCKNKPGYRYGGSCGNNGSDGVDCGCIAFYKTIKGKGIDFGNGKTIKLWEHGSHTLRICYNHKGYKGTIKIGKFQLDKKAPVLDITNMGYISNKTINKGYKWERGECIERIGGWGDENFGHPGMCIHYKWNKVNWIDTIWSGNDINIKLSANDGESGIEYKKYIWDSTNCHGNGTSFTNGIKIKDDKIGKHYLHICSKDKAGNKSDLYSGYYKIDGIPPSLNVDNENYGWEKDNINIKLTTIDNQSGLDYSKFIWSYDGNSSKCVSDGEDFINGQSITLEKEGEYTLYLCAKDIAGNESNVNFGTYKLDKTEPSISLNIPDSILSDNNNFNLKFKLYDNLDGNNNQASYDTYDVMYSYNIIADTKSENNINGNEKSNIEINDTYGLTDSCEVGEKFKIEINFEDKAGNLGTITKEFKVYPNYLNQINSNFVVYSNGDKYANAKEYYDYDIELKDEYGNLIYNKDFKLSSLDTKLKLDETNNSGVSALIYDKNLITNDNGKVSFKLKSYTPGEFDQKFKIIMKKWNKNYVNSGVDQYISKDLGINNFKKPISVEYFGLENSDKIPKIGQREDYKIILKDNGINGEIIRIGKLDFSKNNLELSSDFTWKYFGNKNFNFGNDIGKNLGFSGNIDTTTAYLDIPQFNTNNIIISYKIGYPEKTAKYYLDNISTNFDTSCTIETLGVKIYGILEGEGKSNEVGQQENFSDLSKGTIRSQIRKNAYKLMKGINTSKVVDNIKYVLNEDVIISGDQNYETLIVKNGNVIIGNDLNPSNKKLGIIVLKDNYKVDSDDYKETKSGNIFINKNVGKINAIIYADGTFRSAQSNGNDYPDSALSNLLELNGSLFTRNTIGGSVGELTLPGGKITSNETLAKAFDLNNVRKIVLDCSNYDNTKYSFIIKYNSDVQLNPPIGFEN